MYGSDGINANDKRLLDFYTFNRLRIMIIFLRHKEQHMMTRSNTRVQYSMTDSIIANENTAKKFLDIRTYRGPDLTTILYKLKTSRIPNRKTEKPINTRALNDATNQWLYQKRMNIISEITTRGQDIEKECTNRRNIMMTDAKENLGMVPCRIRPKRMRNWDEELQVLVHGKRLAFRKFIR